MSNDRHHHLDVRDDIAEQLHDRDVEVIDMAVESEQKAREYEIPEHTQRRIKSFAAHETGVFQFLSTFRVERIQ